MMSNNANNEPKCLPLAPLHDRKLTSDHLQPDHRPIPLCERHISRNSGKPHRRPIMEIVRKRGACSREAEIQAAQAKAYAEGAADRISGKIDSITGAITGDRSAQTSGNAQHDSGKVKMESNKPVTT